MAQAKDKLLENSSTKVSGNTGWWAGALNTQFLTQQLLTRPSLDVLDSLLQATPASPALPSTSKDRKVRCSMSTAVPWVTCVSRKSHIDALWEQALLAQPTHPACSLSKYLQSQGEWQWIMSNRKSSLSSTERCPFIVSLFTARTASLCRCCGFPQHSPTWSAEQILSSKDRPTGQPFRDIAKDGNVLSKPNLHPLPF